LSLRYFAWLELELSPPLLLGTTLLQLSPPLLQLPPLLLQPHSASAFSNAAVEHVVVQSHFGFLFGEGSS
jgi:hypothetical protein